MLILLKIFINLLKGQYAYQQMGIFHQPDSLVIKL